MERYAAYKDSGVEWIGEIPESWSLVNLSMLGNQVKNKNEGNLVDNVLSLSYGNIKRRVIDNTGLLPESFETYNIIDNGDVVLRLTDLQNDQVSLRVGRSKEMGIITSAYTTLRPAEAESRFLFYELASFDYWKGFYGLAGGVRQSLTFDGIKSLRFPLPKRSEQIAIADYLDKKTAEIDGIAKETERSIELLREYRKSVISEAVTHGLNPDVAMKDSGIEWIGEIPEDWRLSRIANFVRFNSGDALDSAFMDSDYEYPVYGGGDIKGYSQNSNIPAGTAIVSRQGATCGVSRYIDTDAWATEHALITKPIGKIDVRWLVYWLGFMNLGQYSMSAAQPGISADKIESLPMAVLNFDEQKDIADYLDAKTAEIDELIADKEKQVELLKEYRKSLISEAVTGKFKVPGLE